MCSRPMRAEGLADEAARIRSMAAISSVLIPVRFRDEIHAIVRSRLAGDGDELNRLQAGSGLPADQAQLDRELE